MLHARAGLQVRICTAIEHTARALVKFGSRAQTPDVFGLQCGTWRSAALHGHGGRPPGRLSHFSMYASYLTHIRIVYTTAVYFIYKSDNDIWRATALSASVFSRYSSDVPDHQSRTIRLRAHRPATACC